MRGVAMSRTCPRPPRREPAPDPTPLQPVPLVGNFQPSLRSEYPDLDDLPLEPSWGPDDAIFLLIGIGVAAKAAVVAARELGPTVLFSLRSLGETGALRIAAGEGIEELAETHITRSGRTVLGHFETGYIEKAQARGASYFDIGKVWKGLTDTERWRANRHFLDMIVSNRDRVLLSLPKGTIRAGSWLAREIDYLIKKKGYRWINQWALGPK